MTQAFLVEEMAAVQELTRLLVVLYWFEAYCADIFLCFLYLIHCRGLLSLVSENLGYYGFLKTRRLFFIIHTAFHVASSLG